LHIFSEIFVWSEDDISSILFKGSTAGHDDSCLLARKLKEFESAGFVVKNGQKIIHEENSIRFIREVIGVARGGAHQRTQFGPERGAK